MLPSVTYIINISKSAPFASQTSFMGRSNILGVEEESKVPCDLCYHNRSVWSLVKSVVHGPLTAPESPIVYICKTGLWQAEVRLCWPGLARPCCRNRHKLDHQWVHLESFPSSSESPPGRLIFTRAQGSRLFLTGGSTVEMRPFAVDAAGEAHQGNSWHIDSPSISQNLSHDLTHCQELRRKVKRVDIWWTWNVSISLTESSPGLGSRTLHFRTPQMIGFSYRAVIIHCWQCSFTG